MPYHIPEVDRMIRPDAEQPRIVSIRECARAQGFRDFGLGKRRFDFKAKSESF